ncbi:MAG: selenium metabolism-associated LysR family transcriptional regulator [Pseudomonadota bacterium]|nr:selenium metabolism-associated LysR family transcriptional regulator [Pseudomonadota bacterium]
MLETRHLQVFMAIWELHGFSKAAEKINLTQPTVSGHIKTLEAILGTELFNRSTRDVSPTKAAELFHPYARRILNLMSQAEQEMNLFIGREKGTLEIGGSNIPGEYVLPLAVGQFKKGRPIIKITLKIGDTREIVAAVGEGQLELGMVGAVIERPDIIFEACLVDDLLLVTPPDSPLAGKKQVKMAELTNYPFIMRENGSGTRKTIEKALEQAGDPLKAYNLSIIAEMGSTEAIRQAVKAGVGCSIISRRAVQKDVELGLMSASSLPELNLKRQFYLILPKQRRISPLAEEFRQFMQQNITE